MADQSVAAMFAAAARDFPDRTFLRWCRGSDRTAWTYAQAALRIDHLVTRLDELAIAAGDHVVVHTAEMVPSILFDLACACAGVVFTPIETSSLPAVLDICVRTGARAVLTTPDRTGSYDGRPVVTEAGTGPVTGDPGAAIARLSQRAARVGCGRVYMLQPTSGTTAGSKLVIRDHAVFARVARLMAFGLDRASTPASRVLMVAALTHGMGQYALAIAMSLAAELDVTTRRDVDADIAEIRGLDPTYIKLTPRVLRSLVHQLGGIADSGRIFGPSARYLVTGGAQPDRELLAAVERSGVAVVEAYGASEMSVVALTRVGQWRPDIVGHVVDDVTVRISDDGELQARTPVMMRGYHGAPELTRAAFTEDGFYRTGDRATIGPDGELSYLGRLVDTFNLFDGSHVTPGPIEDAIERLPWVHQVVLLGDQRPHLTGLLVVHEALRCGAASDAPALRRLVERDLGRICSELEPNERVRRVALLDRTLPGEVYQVVGHGKVRRVRAAATTLLADAVAALDGGAVPAGISLIEVPGAARECRTSRRRTRSWLVRIRARDTVVLACTRDVARGGAFIVHEATLALGAPVSVEVIEPAGDVFALDGEVIRNEASGSAVRWVAPRDALDRLRL